VAVETVSLLFTGLLTWTADAACSGQTELFFAPAGERPETRLLRESRARAICRACPADGFRVDMPVGRVARYPRGNGEPVAPREHRVA
jgi:hypothetical protein